MATKTKKAEIPRYELGDFRHVHRVSGGGADFGSNRQDRSKIIDGFELYSGEGLVGSLGPLRSAFYRVSITVSGSLDMQIGLQHYRHQPRTLAFTFPDQIFFKNNISADASGYYILFKDGFLDELLPAGRLPEEFPFLSLTGTPLFQVTDDELSAMVALVYKMEEEMRGERPGRARAVQLYLYLALLEAKRSYLRQGLDKPLPVAAGPALAVRFQKLVGGAFSDDANGGGLCGFAGGESQSSQQGGQGGEG